MTKKPNFRIFNNLYSGDRRQIIEIKTRAEAIRSKAAQSIKHTTSEKNKKILRLQSHFYKR